MAAPRPAGLAWGQSFHHFYERVVGRYLRLASLLSLAGHRSLLATEAVPSAALRTVSISRHTASLNRLRHVQFQCRQTYCPNRKNGRGRKILRASEFFRFYSPLRVDCWRQGLPYVSLPPDASRLHIRQTPARRIKGPQTPISRPTLTDPYTAVSRPKLTAPHTLHFP